MRKGRCGVVVAALTGGLVLAACGGGYGSSASAPGPSTSPPAPRLSSTRTVIRPNETKLGKVLSSNGLTLYGLTTDTSESSTCIGPCFVTWPPVSLPDASVPAGLDPKRFGVITRADGLHQLKIGRRPLFRFVGDAQPGDVNGQGVGGVWFAVDPGGELQR